MTCQKNDEEKETNDDTTAAVPIEEVVTNSLKLSQEDQSDNKSSDKGDNDWIPLTCLHELASQGNLSKLICWIKENNQSTSADGINQPTGSDYMTLLHHAAEMRHS